MRHVFRIVLSALVVALLAGCAGPASQVVIDRRTQATRDQIGKLIAPPPAQETSPVSYSERSWIPLRRIEQPVPETAREQTDAVQIEINQQFGSLNEVAGAVSSLTGLPVVVAGDIAGAGGAGVAPPPAGAPLPTSAMPGAPRPGGGPLPPGFPAPLAAASVPAGPITPYTPFTANYAGSLSGFLHLVAAYYGVSWKAVPGSLRFFLLDSKTYRVAALPGETRWSGSVDGGASTAGGGGQAAGGASAGPSGGSTSTSGVNFNGLSIWAALESSIRQMLGPAGKVVASPATGTISVTDTPAVLERVTEYVDEQNRALNRQVSVSVRVLSVELNEGETYGIQWDAVYANLAAARPYSIGVKTAATTVEGVGNLILSAPSASASRWAGSSAMISALSTQGRVTELTSATVVTLNNQPVPVNVGRRVSYLASSSTSQTANVGSTTSLTPGTVSTGFSMTLVPHIIDGKELLLQYAVDLSSLLRIKTISSGRNSIEAPDVSTSSFLQRVRLASNETLVVAGFDQDNLSAVAEGVGHPENTLMGTRNGSTKRTMLVILIQPTVAL